MVPILAEAVVSFLGYFIIFLQKLTWVHFFRLYKTMQENKNGENRDNAITKMDFVFDY